MQEAIRRGLAKTIEKIMTCPSLEQTIGQKALPGSALGGSPHLWLHTTDRHAALATQKRNTRRFALVSIRFGLVLMSLCGSFLLTLAVQGMINSPAMAAGPAPAPAPNNANLNNPGQGNWIPYYHGPCVSFPQDGVPNEWQDSAYGDVCDATSDAGFAHPSNGGSCPQYQMLTTTATGDQECVLTVPTFKGSCPLGFAIDGGLCEYEPQDSADWQVGFCRSFKSYEVPLEWITRNVCDIDPIPNPESKFVAQPAANGSCQQNWVSTLTSTGQQECILTVPAFKGACPIGFTLDQADCTYVPQDRSHWQVGFCHAFSGDEIPSVWNVYHVCDTNPVPDPEQTFIQPGPCQKGWIATTAETTQTQCLLTIPERWGNRFLTAITNMLYDCRIHDMTTCYKLIPRNVVCTLPMQGCRFEIDPEMTASILQAGYRIFEVPISYQPRKEKKLQPWKDGWPTLAMLLRCRFKTPFPFV